MNAYSKEPKDASAGIELQLIVNRPVLVKNPANPLITATLPSGTEGTLERIQPRIGEPWLILPAYGGKGLPERRFREYWKNGVVEIEKKLGDGAWEEYFDE
jgi:hypothetical protein